MAVLSCVQGVYVAETAADEATSAAASNVDKSVADYEYDDDEFDMEAEMLRREFREASLLANGCGTDAVTATTATTTAAAVLEPSSQTQVDLTADRRLAATAATAPLPQQRHAAATAADHSSGGSSSVDSRAAENAYAYRGNQSEYGVADKHVKGAAVVVGGKSIGGSAANNNNDDEYLVEQRLLGNGADGSAAANNCSPDAAAVGAPPAATVAAVAQ